MRKKSFSNSNDLTKTWRQSAYQRGNQRESSPSYVLLYSDGDCSGDEENIPLTSVKSNHHKNTPRKIEVIEVRPKSEDTLQALALRYRCSISEIKRINKIHADNEIHARRTVKVPVPPFSILTESLEDNTNETISQELTQEPATSSREDEIINLISTPIVSTLPILPVDINEIILRSANEPINGFLNVPEIYEKTEQDSLLSNAESGTVENVDTHSNYNFKCSGADWGISWLQLLGVSLLLGFAGPIIYILYLSTSSSKRRSALGH